VIPRVVAVDPSSDPRWDAYVTAHPEAVVFQHSAYLRALAREYGRPVLGLACEDGGGRLLGVLPLMWTRGVPLARSVAGRRLSSLPRTPVAGPLADDEDALGALVRAGARRAAERGGAQLQLKPPAAHLDGIAPLTRHPWRSTYVYDLPSDGKAPRFGNSRNHARIRWAVGKAERAGLRVRRACSEADVRRWYPLMLEALRPHAVPPRRLGFLLALWEELEPRGMMRLLLAETATGELQAGVVLLMLRGGTVFYAFNGVRSDALQRRPNDLIQWQALHDAAQEGFHRYDFGEVVAEQAGLADFKRKWGTREVPLQRYYHPAPEDPPDPGAGPTTPLRHAAQRTWQRLPLRATTLVGTEVYRWL
jgi:CelD/BcsL family acetyltransferase involved in cellulose biosynthesis